MNDYWCIPSKEDADFVACMEDVLDVYELPYDPMSPIGIFTAMLGVPFFLYMAGKERG